MGTKPQVTPNQAVSIIKSKFSVAGGPVKVPLLKKKGRGYFLASLVPDGIEVDNLGSESLLVWDVFRKTVQLLNSRGGSAERGNAMNAKLGSPALPLDSVEGHIAHQVFGVQTDCTVFRRITPIACILIWAGLCKHAPGKLILCQAAGTN